MKLFFYNLTFPFLFILYLPFLVKKIIKRGGYDREFWERFGLFSNAKKSCLRSSQNPIWIHAVSVGETVAALSFLQLWQERNPQQQFVFSTTTTTGHALAKKKLPSEVILIYCPLDFFFFVRKALTLIKPAMLVIFEVEVWPGLILQSKKQCPVVLVNGRMSDKSAAGYAKHSWFFGELFQAFSTICVQTSADSARVKKIVGDKVPVHICNTMKFDQIPDSKGSDKSQFLEKCFGDDNPLVWTVGSTHAGEEAMVCRVFKELKKSNKKIKMILVPRHVERTKEVIAELDDAQLSYRLLKDDDKNANSAEVEVLLVNTTGELMNFYAAADLVYVGKSMAGQEGGHNIIEPAIFGKAIIHGDKMQNFRAVAITFQENRATIQVKDEQELLCELCKLATNCELRTTLGSNARQVVETFRGSINKTLGIITPLVNIDD